MRRLIAVLCAISRAFPRLWKIFWNCVHSSLDARRYGVYSYLSDATNNTTARKRIMTTATKTLTNEEIESLLFAIDSANYNAREAINNYEDSRAAFMHREIANNDLKQAFLCARDDRRMLYKTRTPAEVVRDCNDLLAIHNLSPLSPSPAAAFGKFMRDACE